jgi:hypothetical protein
MLPISLFTVMLSKEKWTDNNALFDVQLERWPSVYVWQLSDEMEK